MRFNRTSFKAVILACVIFLATPLASFSYPTDLEKLVFLEYQYHMQVFKGNYPEFSMALWMLANEYIQDVIRGEKPSHDYWTWDERMDRLGLHASALGERHILDLAIGENIGIFNHDERNKYNLLMSWSQSLPHFYSIFDPKNKYAALRIVHEKDMTFMVWYVAE